MPSFKYGMAISDDGTKIAKWSPEMWAKYKELKAETKTPLRLWTGSCVIVSLFAMLYIAGLISTHFRNEKAQIVADYFAHPQVGDILYGSMGGKTIIDNNTASETGQVYALFKIQKINGDSIFLFKGNVQEVNTPEHPVNEYASGFWEKLRDQTSTYKRDPIIISHKEILYDKRFSILPKNENVNFGKVYNILREE
jgi:hypothetical protein